MRLHNKYPYSEEWDNLLNKLVSKGEILPSTHVELLVFKLETGTKEVGWIFKTKIPSYTTYKVWVANRDIAYGGLWSKDNETLPDEAKRSPKQETLEKLYVLEKSLMKTDWYE